MRKLKVSIAASLGILLALSPISAVFASEGDVLDGEALLITSGDPFDPKYANAGENLRTGVGSMFTVFESTAPSGFLCSMTVINDLQILTAAHCLRNTVDGEHDPLVQVIVVLPSGVNYILFDAVGFAVHPLYDFLNPLVGAFASGDVAVIEMASDIPADVERYDMYRDSDELGQETRHYGHGRFGKGPKGSTGGADFFYARTGLNMYEATLAPFFDGNPLFDQLLHDFDSGGDKHNAMDWWFSPGQCGPENENNPPWAQDGQCTTYRAGVFPDKKGFGKFEVGVAPGDSGGPGFINGEVAGIHSFGFTHFCEGVTNGTDISCGLNSSYGEMSGDTPVSNYASWVDDVGGAVALTPIPEPAPVAPAAATSGTIGLSAYTQSFLSNVFVERMRAPMTFEQVKKDLDLE